MKRLDAGQADHLWALARSLDGTVRTFTATPADRSEAELQRAVDRAATGATAAALIPAVPSVGGFVTRAVLSRAAENVTDAARSTVALAAVLAVARIGGVTDDAQALGVAARALTGRDLPAGWAPPTDGHGGSAWKGARTAADLASERGALWQRGLGMMPLVGVVGAGLAGQRTVHVVLERACRELGLPAPTTASPARTVRDAARAVRRHLPG